jgi:hypothetical protein
MSTTALDDLQGLIQGVRVAAEDPRGAYLIRSRLRRSLLACVRVLAQREGVSKPALAGQWVNPTDPQAVIVEGLCRRVYDRAQLLCQPSESFDVRWEDGWHDLQADLSSLEAAVAALDSAAPVYR